MLKYFIMCLLLPLHIYAKYDLSICAIFQNEGPYLKEWIEFHKLQGVKHFYLYNNNSDDNFRKVLKSYVDKKVVTLIPWLDTYDPWDTKKWGVIQRGAYMDCINTYGMNSKWIAFIDSDEFLFCPSGKKLTVFLKDYTEHAAVCANWLMFGTSDMEDIPSKYLMIEVLSQCDDRNAEVNKHIKSIVQPEHVASCPNPHYFIYKNNQYAVAANRSRLDGPLSAVIDHDNIRINHYWTRTEKYLREFKIPSRMKRRKGETEASIRKDASEYNKSYDTAILDFVPKLRRRMGYDK